MDIEKEVKLGEIQKTLMSNCTNNQGNIKLLKLELAKFNEFKRKFCGQIQRRYVLNWIKLKKPLLGFVEKRFTEIREDQEIGF